MNKEHIPNRRSALHASASTALLLAIDVGNTHITIGVFKESSLLRTWRLHTQRDATSDELGLLFTSLLKQSTRHDDHLEGVCLAEASSPLLDGALAQACRNVSAQNPVEGRRRGPDPHWDYKMVMKSRKRLARIGWSTRWRFIPYIRKPLSSWISERRQLWIA